MIHSSYIAPANWTARIVAPDGNAAEVKVRYHKRARRLSVKINQATGEVIATCPKSRIVTKEYIQSYLDSNAEEIVGWSVQFSRKYPFTPGSTIYYFGRKYKLEVSPTDECYIDEPYNTIYAPLAGFWGDFKLNVRQFLYLKLTNFVVDRCKVHAYKLGVELAGIDVGVLKNAWGTHGMPSHNINFHWQIVGAPAEAIDCVCAHEVSHIIHQHHRPSFWKTVYTLIPEAEYKKQHEVLNLDKLGGQLSGLGVD